MQIIDGSNIKLSVGEVGDEQLEGSGCSLANHIQVTDLQYNLSSYLYNFSGTKKSSHMPLMNVKTIN